MRTDVKINGYSGPLENNHAPVPRGAGKTVSRHGLGRSQEVGTSDFLPMDALREQAGVRDGVNHRLRSLYHRVFSSLRQRMQQRGSSSARRSSRSASRAVEDDDDEIDDALLAATMDTLDLLRDDTGRGRQAEVEEMLRQMYDVVGSYDVLAEALERIKDEPIGEVKKIAMTNALNEMMSNLQEKYPHELRRALQDRDAMINSLDALTTDDNGKKSIPTRKLRQMVGGKQDGNEDLPLTPLTMLKALIKNFGAHKCMNVMTGLRSRMMTGF